MALARWAVVFTWKAKASYGGACMVCPGLEVFVLRSPVILRADTAIRMRHPGISDEQSGLMRPEDEPDDAQRAHANALVTQLFVEHARLLKRNFSRICRQQDKLDDLIQEAFIALRRALSRPTNDPVRNPIALLYTIAGDLLTDQVRREVARNRFSQPLDALASQVPDPAVGLDEWLCRNESLRLRQQIVNELPVEQRRAVELRVQGLKPAEIAKEMHVSAMRVYRLLRLALERCHRRWRELEIEEGR